jgi:hypothetical protein
MLKNLLALSGLVVLAACGSVSASQSSSLEGASAGTVTREAALLNVSAKAVNGGINPLAFAYDVEGDVFLGSNSCEAAGSSATLEAGPATDGVVTVVAKETAQVSDEPRICPRIYQPVYAHVSVTVRGNRSDVRAVQVKNVNELGTLVDIDDLTRAGELVLSHVTVRPTNGGINPDAFAYDIKATVVAGSNACEAAANPVELRQQKIGGVIYVKAVHLGRDGGVACTREYQPVTAEVAITVRGFSSDTTDVIIRNVDQLGADQKAESLVP